MRAGKLDRKVTLQQRAAGQDTAGEEVDSWITVGKERRAASYRPLRGSERFQDEQLIAREQVEFKLRLSAAVNATNPRYRVIYPALAAGETIGDVSDDRIYDVLAVHELGRREGLQLMAVRRAEK